MKTREQGMMKMQKVLVGSLWVVLAGCLPAGEAQDPVTEQFRSGLVGEKDIRMELGASSGQRQQALNGQTPLMAAITMDVVGGTNEFLAGHLRLMHFVVGLPPVVAEEDRHVWEGVDRGHMIRVTMERSVEEEGIRFDYRMEGRRAASTEDTLLTYFDGHVLRLNQESEGDGEGWGLVRYYFDNLGTLEEHQGVSGTGRIAFSLLGDMHRVRVHLDDIKTPEDPNFAEVAIFDYNFNRAHAGELRFFSRGDVKGDGAPFEDAAITSRWASDRAGVAQGLITGGSMEVDYWHLSECWDTLVHKTYASVGTPSGHLEEGDMTECVEALDGFDVPEIDAATVAQDPQIPGLPRES